MSGRRRPSLWKDVDLNVGVPKYNQDAHLHLQPCIGKLCFPASLKVFPPLADKRGQPEHCPSCRFTMNQNERSAPDKLIFADSLHPVQTHHNKVKTGARVRQEWKQCGRTVCASSSSIFFVLSLLMICVACRADSNQCAVGISTPGRTWPPGDIVLEYGNSLKIYCILNEVLTDTKFRGKNASDLVFFRNKEEMESEYITVLNETTIMLYVDKPDPSEDMYYCKLRLTADGSNKQNEAVCLNKVLVGHKPKAPIAFSCVSQNWDNLTCTWVPAHNFIPTHFKLWYKLQGRGGRTLYPCPERIPAYNLPENTCLWNSNSTPHYRMVNAVYRFILNASNVLGSANFTYLFHHFEHVIPAKPLDLSVVNKTYSSGLLHWNVSYPMENFPPGLFHRVSYQSQWDSTKTWKVHNITTKERANEKYFNLTGLQYANAVYDVRVFMKSAVAKGEDAWSDFSSITFKTAATLPGLPPQTDVGSFEIAGNSGNRDVYVYWQTIPPYLENGDNFTYKVIRVVENGRVLDIQPQETTKTYAKFKGISFNSFTFEIVTANCKGENNRRAIVHVPSQLEMPREPVAFTKIAFDGGLYELSWNPSDSKITNYTIFWCENDRDRPYQCSGYLDWVQVSRNTTIYNMTVPDARKVYQFAIAANTERASSGMVWASCTAIHNKVVGKMKSVWINHINSHQIEVGWKLECSDRIDIVEGFNIYYCPIVTPFNLTCKVPQMNTTVTDPHTIHGVVNNLKPYTTYMLTVAVMTKNGEGLHSDPLYNTTLEAAPAAPHGVVITNVTNTTMVVEWNPPPALNGVLKYYLVHYNENTKNAEKATRFEITDLEPYKNYTISVSACTVSCGKASTPVFNTTDIGVPGKTDVPVVRFVNSSQVSITWNAPREPAGKLDYYEILTAVGYIHTNITSGKEKHLDIPDCNSVGRDNLNHFRVRAVNLRSDKVRLEGPWSESGEGNCYNNGPSAWVWIMIWIIGSLSGVAFLLFLGYTSKRLWIKCKAMQDVEVKLPPGLQQNSNSNSKLLENGNEHHTQQLSADSSGCSSGQESVTSSLTSDSHVSTDSGADLDPVPMSPTKLLDLPPTWESTRLRQRNVTGTTKTESCGDRESWEPYVKVAKSIEPASTDSLCLARSTPDLVADNTTPGLYTSSQQHTWSSTGYISMPSSEEDSSSSPSPLPRGKASTQGVYCVVGLAASTTPMPTLRARAAPERSHPQTANLIPICTDAKPATPANPYVSLASLEQKTRNPGTLHVPSVSDYGDMGMFDAPVKEQKQMQQHQQTYKPEELDEEDDEEEPPFLILDKLSKPYVKTGLMDGKIKSLVANAGPSGGRPPFAPLPSVSQGSLIKLPSTAYVPVDTICGTRDMGQVDNPYVAVSTLAANPRNCDDRLTTPCPFPAQRIETSRSGTKNFAAGNDPVTRPIRPLAVKQTSGYVTIAENPTMPVDNQALNSSSLSYVPHQRVNKKLPPSQRSVGQTDEQYSKVTVVPTTT